MSTKLKIQLLIVTIITAFISFVILGIMAYSKTGFFEEEPVLLSIEKSEKTVVIALSEDQMKALCRDKLLSDYQEKYIHDANIKFKIETVNTEAFGSEDSGVWCYVKYKEGKFNVQDNIKSEYIKEAPFRIVKKTIFDMEEISKEQFTIEFEERKKIKKIEK